MKKLKLIEARENKGYSQEYMSNALGIAESSYCRRENGLTKIIDIEWEKISQILEVPVNEIRESDENHFFICNDNASVNYQGSNNTIYSVPEFMLETQQKYIQKLEKENLYLQERLKKYEK